MGNTLCLSASTSAPPPKIQEIAPGCFRLRVPFYIFFFDVGTHMTFLRLKNGKFLVLSAVSLDDNTKPQVDQLTQNGDLIDAIVATNPFHTTAFSSWFEMYPRLWQKGRVFGTPRHVRNFPDLPWAGSSGDEQVQKLWEPEVSMRIPAGCEFNDPKPELTNHFNGVIALYRSSKILICDDAFHVGTSSSFLESLLTPTQMSAPITFHASMPNQALDKTPKAARQFYDWVLQLTRDWDFDSMTSSHGSFVIGGAKQGLLDCLENARKSLSDHSVSNGGDPI
ncbi:hypothetical protein BDR26DRAFT_871110 [Obelidium mucronatum]|nr:hypothetical protein BDR26DRAFT_871110 [Obelidium mucronatum]